MATESEKLLAELKKANLRIEAFKRYLPNSVVQKILSDPSFTKAEGEYRLVTVLFADLSGFTHLSEELSKSGKKGAEEITDIINAYFTKMFEIADNYEGTIHKLVGDAIIVLFGAPIRHEDDPERAVRAAIDMQFAMQEFRNISTLLGKFSLKMSIGINTGLVVAGNVGNEKRMDYTVMGDNVNLASRLEQKAKPGEILISKATYERIKNIFDVSPLAPIKVKGKAEPIDRYKIIGISGAGFELPKEAQIKMIGRDKELRTLSRLLKKVLDSKGQVVSIVGEAGIGKSKLIYELKIRTPKALWIGSRALSYGSSPLFVILELLRDFFGIREFKSEGVIKKKIKLRMANLGLNKYVPFIYNLFQIKTKGSIINYLDTKAIKQNTYDAIKYCLIEESKIRPIVIVFEDFHWVDYSSLELLQYISSGIENNPILILCVFRKSENDLSPSLKREIQHYFELPVVELSGVETEILAKSLLGIQKLPDELSKIIIERSGGNPLYLEELLNSLIENGLLKKNIDKWELVSTEAGFLLPDTIEGIIISRVDRLDEKLRRVLQIASVIGRSFQYKVLKYIHSAPELDKSITALQEIGMIYKKSGILETEYEFSHLLTQEITYNSLLIKTKSYLHGKIGLCIENLYKEQIEDFYGLLAHHYLHSMDKNKAVIYLAKAGEKSEKLYAGKEALNYYSSAIDVLGEKNVSEEIRLLLNCIRVKTQFLGDYKGAFADCEKALMLSENIGDKKLEAESVTWIGIILRRKGEYNKALLYYNKAINIFRELGDRKSVGRLLNRIGLIYDDMGRFDEALAFYNQFLEVSKEIGDESDVAMAINNIGIIYDSKGNDEQALKYYNEALSIETKYRNKRGIARILSNIGLVYIRLGDYSSALSYLERGYKIVNEISDRSEIASCLSNIGKAYYGLLEYSKALKYQKQALEMSQKLGAQWEIANSLDEIGIVYQRLGKWELAIDHHTQALNIAQKIGAKAIEANVLINLGIVQFKFKEIKEAEKLIKSGISIATEIGSKEVLDYGKKSLNEIGLKG